MKIEQNKAMLVRLFRDSFETPWGFRLQGGRDLNQELVVQRVSIADDLSLYRYMHVQAYSAQTSGDEE